MSKSKAPEICLMTKSWRYSAGWIAQMIALSIAEQGVKIAFVAPKAEPESREPIHSNLSRFLSPRELVGTASKHRRIIASLKRIFAGIGHVLALRTRTSVFIFTIPEPLVITIPLFTLLRVTGARILFIVHDATPHAWSLPFQFRLIERLAHSWSYRLATTIVTLTPSVGAVLSSEFNISPSKIVVIPHGPLPLGDVSPIKFSRKLLVFGTLRRNKGILEVIRGVIQARANGQRVQLLLVGEPSPQETDYWETCVQEIAQDPLGFDVRVGFLPDEQLPALVCEVDAFVLAYRDFASQSGVAILAALTARPVIGSKVGGLGELFDLGMSGEILEDEFTPAEFASAVASFYSHDVEYWQRRSAEGAQKIAETLRWDRIADAFISVARIRSINS